MSTSTQELQQGHDFGRDSTGPRLKLTEVSEPGAYVCHWNGDLLRVTEGESPAESRPQLPANLDPQSCLLTQISSNPYIGISAARIAAANFDLEIRF